MNQQLPISLSIARTVKHTASTWSFFMSSSNPLPGFIAGQVAVLEIDNYGESYFAFASAPDESEFEFLVKHKPAFEITTALFENRAKTIELKNIVGKGFPIADYKGHDLVFVAMGTGLAPLRSTLRHLFSTREDFGRLFVLFGARTVEDFYYQNEMTVDWRRHDVELRQVISQPGDSDWDGPTGYVQSLLDSVLPEMNNPLALVCGSPEMQEQTKKRLNELGFAPEKILTNY